MKSAFLLGGTGAVRAEHGQGEVCDIFALVGAIEHHAFEDIDKIVIDIAEFLDDGAIVTRWMGIGDEIEHGVGEFIEIDPQAEKG
jgi:hypothetical protein